MFPIGSLSSPLATTRSSAGTLNLDFVEIAPLLGQRRLDVRLSLGNVEPFSVMFIALKNENPKLEFTGWDEEEEYGGRTLCAEVDRNGEREVILGILFDGAADGNGYVGTVRLNVTSSEELQLTPEDFALVTAEFMADESATGAAPVTYRLGGKIGASRTVEPVVFRNALAQNYPNPFNPTTTIAFL